MEEETSGSQISAVYFSYYVYVFVFFIYETNLSVNGFVEALKLDDSASFGGIQHNNSSDHLEMKKNSIKKCENVGDVGQR